MKTKTLLLLPVLLLVTLLGVNCADDDDKAAADDDLADDDDDNDDNNDNDSGGNDDDDNNDNDNATDDDSLDDDSPVGIRIFTASNYPGYHPYHQPWLWSPGWVDVFEYAYGPKPGRWENLFSGRVVYGFQAANIWAASPSDGFIVGGWYTPFVLWTKHFPHGRRLRAFPTALLAGVESLYAVWGSSSSDVFAVGGSENADLIVHFNGITWSFMELDEAPCLLDVWGLNSKDVFAVGCSGTIRHYDGEAWSAMNGVTGATLRGVHGASGSNVFAVGDHGTVVRYDGIEWKLVPFPDAENQTLYSVWCTEPNQTFVVGIEWIDNERFRGIYRWDGLQWTELRYEKGPYSKIWGVSPDNFFVSGDPILHWNGTDWETLETAWGDGADTLTGVVVDR